MTAYDVDLKTLDGSGDVMDAARGKVTLLVNVASKCGLTPQYEQLEQLPAHEVEQEQRHQHEDAAEHRARSRSRDRSPAQP